MITDYSQWFILVKKLTSLEKGIATYGGDPPSLESIVTAGRIVGYLFENGFNSIFVDTHVEGGIFVEVRTENKYLNFETYNDEDKIVVYSIGNRHIKKEDFLVGEFNAYSSKELKEVIKKFK